MNFHSKKNVCLIKLPMAKEKKTKTKKTYRREFKRRSISLKNGKKIMGCDNIDVWHRRKCL